MRIKPYVGLPIRVKMNGQFIKRTIAITILLGMLALTTASGSDLKLSLHSSGPPKIQNLPKALRQTSSTKTLPASMPSSRIIREMSSYTPSHLKQAIVRPKTQAVKPHRKLGWRYLLNEQPQAAMASYRQAIRHNPKSARAYLGLGISLKRLGKAGLAKKALLKAIDINPRLASALVHLGYLYAEGHFGQTDLPTAHRLFREASQLGDPFAAIAILDLKSGTKL